MPVQRKKKAAPRRKQPRTLIETIARLLDSPAFRAEVARDAGQALRRFGLAPAQIRALERAQERRFTALLAEIRKELTALAAMAIRFGPFSYTPPMSLVGATATRGGISLRGRGLRRGMQVRFARKGHKPVTARLGAVTTGKDLFAQATLRKKLAAGRYDVSVRSGSGAWSDAVSVSIR